MRANCGKPKNKSVKLMEVIVEKKEFSYYSSTHHP